MALAVSPVKVWDTGGGAQLFYLQTPKPSVSAYLILVILFFFIFGLFNSAFEDATDKIMDFEQDFLIRT